MKFKKQCKGDRHKKIILNYFKRNNLKPGITYKYTKMLYKVYTFFDKPVKYQMKNIKYILPELKGLYSISLRTDPDYRTGKETYGYEPSTIEDNFEYISDRWRCSFRIKWLIDYAELCQ